ncbi:MAG: SCO family protein [Chitinophagales bacterium]|nr:SCO family protein [Chitinophagales bacterium]
MNLKSIFISILLLIAFSCQQKKECCKKDANSETQSKSALSDESIYQLTSDWKKQDGTTIKLESMRGKIVVAAMVFTNCASACPRIVADIQRIEKEVNSNDVHFLLISMDPEKDTPERFREFAKERGIGDQWTMISSVQSSTDEIANVLGVKIKKLSDGGFDHSNSIYVLDVDGSIAHIQEGLEQEPTQAIAKIKELIAKM